MNKLFTLLVASALTLGAYAQTTVEVVTGASYTNEVYYSFTDGSVATSARTDWDIAFPTNRYGIYVLANNGVGVDVYTYPNGTIDDWATLDTAGFSTWPKMYNSNAEWADGAFMQNQVEDSQLDYGWGQYSMLNHHIVGDSLFVIKTAAGNFKKLAIVDKDPNLGANTWEFKYADLDGSNEKEVILGADAYTAKTRVAYSLDTDQIIDNEPNTENWELLFTKYYDTSIPYYVSGVLSNSSRVEIQEVSAEEQEDFITYNEDSFTDTISQIGSDWKTFSMASFSYVLDTTTVFFAKVMNEDASDSTYWKMYFTGFTGASEGKYSFVQQELGGDVATSNINEIAMLEAYPNPATTNINVVFDATSDVQISIYDLSGKSVYQMQTNSIGFTTENINIHSLSCGLYTIVVQSETQTNSIKFVKQ